MTETLGERLRYLRQRKALSMGELAEKLQLSTKGAVSRWERDIVTPRDKTLKAYADYFNVPVDWIKYGELKEEKQMDNNDVLATAIIFQALKTEELTLGEVIDHESNIDASINILKMIKEGLNDD